jgi:hypothetical protein
MTQTNNNNAVQSANAKIESIRQAIINGDTKLTSADLAAARSELEFAELQESAWVIAEQKAIEASRRANLLALKETLAKLADTRPAIDKKFTAFEKSLTDYLSAVVVHQKELQAIRDAIQTGGFAEGYMPGPIEGIDVSIGRTVEIGATSARNIEPIEAIKLLTERLLDEFSQNLRTKKQVFLQNLKDSDRF